MNGEQRSGFVRFVNQLQMASFGAFTGELRTTIVLLALTTVDLWLLTRHATEILYSKATDPLTASAAVSVFLAHNTGAEQMRQLGLYLAGVIVAAVLGKSVTSVIGQKNVRETSREYVEAKAKGEAAATAEHAALPPLHVEHADKVEQRVEQVPVGAVPTEEHKWASGDANAGVI